MEQPCGASYQSRVGQASAKRFVGRPCRRMPMCHSRAWRLHRDRLLSLWSAITAPIAATRGSARDMAYRLKLRGVRGEIGFGLPHGPNAVKHKTPCQAPLPRSWAADLEITASGSTHHVPGAWKHAADTRINAQPACSWAPLAPPRAGSVAGVSARMLKHMLCARRRLQTHPRLTHQFQSPKRPGCG